MSAAPRSLTAEVWDSPSAADAAKWDLLAGAASSFFLSSAWLKLVAGEPGVDSARVTVSDDSGHLLAALPVSFCEVERNSAYRACDEFPGLSGEWTLSTSHIGAHRGYENDVLLRAGLAPHERSEALATVWEAAQHWTAAHSPRPALAWYLGTEQAAELHRDGHCSFPLLTCVTADIHLPGAEFPAYLDQFSRRRRQEFEREMRSAAQAGLDLGVEKLSDVWQEAGPLLAQTMRRYGHPYDDESGTGTLRRQAEHFGDRAVVTTCRSAGRLLGFACAYPWQSSLVLRTVGFDYANLPGAFEYFNLAYYAMARYAYSHGYRVLRLGTGSLQAKVKRGAAVVPRWTVVAAEGGGPTAEEALAWNAGALRRLAEGIPDVEAAVLAAARRAGLTGPGFAEPGSG